MVLGSRSGSKVYIFSDEKPPNASMVKTLDDDDRGQEDGYDAV